MLLPTSVAFGRWLTPTNYEVQCSRCLEVIGTLKFKELFNAIQKNKYKGGIMCSSCRKHSCFFCGTDLRDIKVPKKVIAKVESEEEAYGEDWGYVQICTLCHVDHWEVITDELPF